MISTLLFALWFLLPAAAANVTPILASKIPYLNQWKAPIDGGRLFRGRPILGPHKTWLGLLSGMLVAAIVFALQAATIGHHRWASDIASGLDYSTLPVWLFGAALGFGALGGDAVESFFKRRARVESGHAWVPWDQVDYIIGAILISLLFVRLDLDQYAAMLVVWFVIHLVASYVGYRTGFKERPI